MSVAHPSIQPEILPVPSTSIRVWPDRRVSLLLSVVVPIAAGVVAAWLAPRGPVTMTAALAWMGGLLLVGVLAGFVSASRWSLLLAPTAFWLAFEVARAGTSGPTVDGIHVGSMYGVIALVVGRGATLVLTLPPMILGVTLGLALAARARRPGAVRPSWLRWAFSVLLAVVVVALAVMLVRPASTAPIMDPDGGPVVGSIAELTRVPIGGHDQALMIRGRSADNPVLLHLAGGPGGTDLGAMRADVGLEQSFVVVTWEQRGSGKSYTALDPVETLTLDQAVADTIELSEHLRDRFGEERIYLTGNSWGATLGVLAAQQRPDLYHVFVGTGQMVSQRATDVMFWEDTIAWAASTGQADLAASLRENGPPPYADILDYEPALSHEHDWNPYPDFDNDRELPATLFVPENDLMDQVNGLRAFLDTFGAVYPQLQDIDFRVDVPALEVPLYVVIGAHEARGRAVPAQEWFAMVEAPSKEWIVFEHSGHRPSFEEPAAFTQLMERVRDETYPRVP